MAGEACPFVLQLEKPRAHTRETAEASSCAVHSKDIEMNCTQKIGAIALALAVVPTAWSAGNKGMSEAQRQFQQERAYCLSGKSQQDRATCLTEANNAYAEARRGALNNSGAGANLSQNATERCKAQPPADQDACVRRVTGAGNTEGSVKGGGVLRETETQVK
jgi:hypothetical protein